MQSQSLAPNRLWLSQFWHLAWPVSLQSIFIQLLALIDVMMVAQLGEAEVAAVGYASRAFFVVIIIMAGFGTACSTLCAQHWGKKNWGAIANTVAISGYLGLIFSLCASAFLILQPQLIMQLVSNDPALIEFGREYSASASAMLVLTLPVMLFEAALRSTGETKLPLYVSLLAVVCNIGLNQVLIFGFAGIPALGVVGAGLASVIARAIQLAVLVYILVRAAHPLLAALKPALGRFKASEYAAYCKLALPLVSNFAIWSCGVFVLATLFGMLGTEELAVMSMISPLEGIAISCFMGFAAASSILIGNKLGANQFQAAWQDACRSMLVSPIVAFGFGVVLWLVSPLLLQLFGELPDSSRDLAEQLIIALAFSVWLKTNNMVMINGVLRSGGDNRFCLINDTLCQWGVGIALTAIAIGVFDVGLIAAFYISLSEEAAKSILALWRVYSKKWMRNLTAAPPCEACVTGG